MVVAKRAIWPLTFLIQEKKGGVEAKCPSVPAGRRDEVPYILPCSKSKRKMPSRPFSAARCSMACPDASSSLTLSSSDGDDIHVLEPREPD